MWICAGIYLILFILFVVSKKKKIPHKMHEKTAKRIWALMLCVTTLAAVLEIIEPKNETLAEEFQIERNGYGEGEKREKLQMQIEDEKPEEVEIQISPRMYSREELEMLWQQAMAKLEIVILGENETADHVDKDLYLPDRLDDFPFMITWELDRYDVMDMLGRLRPEEIEKADPEARGIMVTVRGILRYEGEEAAYSREVLVFSREKEEKGISKKVLEMVRRMDEQSREEAYVRLPQRVEGKQIKWSQKEPARTIPILILGIIGSVLLICLEKQKRDQERKDRNTQMLLDYPEIVSQFTMLMGAGMTAKNVWKKMAEDYQRQKQDTGRVRAAYEEILYTCQEMQSGISETECYERFGRRCELVPYMKMGALLAQNLKKGTRGISEMLRMEAIQAMEERKSRAKQLGEEAGTKLLMPMLLMLIVVLTIVVVPAFLSIQM